MLQGTQRIDEAGHLEVGGVDTVDLARRFGTPLYVIDEESLRARCREYVRTFQDEIPGSAVAFASKAFFCRAMASLVREEGLDVDAASVGEMRVALAGGMPPERITFHGNYKKDEEIAAAVDAGVGVFVLDSMEEARALSEIARARGRRQRAIVRVAPGIDAHTLDAISTGRNDTKFGFTVENGTALRAVAEALALAGVDLTGIHAHIGSQILDMAPFSLLVEKMLDFAAGARRETGWTPTDLVLGGGLGIRYGSGDSPPSVRDLARAIGQGIRDGATARGIPMPQVGVEPGRSIVGEAGLTLYAVGPVKEVPIGDGQSRIYVSVDGGLSDNPRPLMYGATYPVILADRALEDRTHEVRVAGRHCETDTLFDARLPLPRPGDLLAVLSTGAYNHTMASNYNLFCRPPVVFVAGGRARLVVRRESEEDLLRRDV